jgi:acyl dehydratase
MGNLPYAVGMLGVDDVTWLAPVACGDTIRCEIDVLPVRLSKDPARVVMRHRVLNQNDRVVLRYRSGPFFATSSATPNGAGS